MNDDNVHYLPESPEVAAERAAEDGYVAGTAFARWIAGTAQVDVFVRALYRSLPNPSKANRDFLDGFWTGAEDEHGRQIDPNADPPPFKVEWFDVVDIEWGSTEGLSNRPDE